MKCIGMCEVCVQCPNRSDTGQKSHALRWQQVNRVLLVGEWLYQTRSAALLDHSIGVTSQNAFTVLDYYNCN